MKSRQGRPRRAVVKGSRLRSLRVYVEGGTEETYLVGWWRVYRANVNIAVSDYRGGPLQLIKRAIADKAVDVREAKRKRGAVHDEYWCVFDIDEHPNVAEAIELAEFNEIQLAISNPCIELWFVLHYESQTGYIHRHDAQTKSKIHLGCEKVLTEKAGADLIKKYAEAKTRATNLDRKHVGDGTPPGSNPSSGVWRIIDSICKFP